jgi:tryptophanyl-tRNA synthetase
MMEEIGPIQNRVKEINEKPEYMIDVLKTGATRCKAIAEKVMEEVREKIGVKTEWRKQG